MAERRLSKELINEPLYAALGVIAVAVKGGRITEAERDQLLKITADIYVQGRFYHMLREYFGGRNG